MVKQATIGGDVPYNPSVPYSPSAELYEETIHLQIAVRAKVIESKAMTNESIICISEYAWNVQSPTDI